MSRPLNLRRDFFSPQSSLLISAEKDFYPDRKTLLSRPQTTVIPTKDYCHPDQRLLSSRPKTTVIPTTDYCHPDRSGGISTNLQEILRLRSG